MSNPSPDLIDRITHGDRVQVLRGLPSESIDRVLTDPPYLVRYRDRQGRSIENDDNNAWMYPAFAEVHRVLKPHAYCVCFYSWVHADRFLSVWRMCGVRPVGHLVWAKPYASRTQHVQMRLEQAYLLVKGSPALPAKPCPDVLPWKHTGNLLHPTQKPVESLMPLIESYSKPGDLILDPFAGSGSTAIAARTLRRRFIAIEKDSTCWQAASKRLAS